MPRCQWCRQDSQDSNICDWCKRPLVAGWTPAVAAAAIPAERMSFAVDDEPSSDRLLMFSVLGIVLVVAVAFAYSMLTRKQALPSVQPPVQAVVAQTPHQPTQAAQDNSPLPGPGAPPATPAPAGDDSQYSAPTYQAPQPTSLPARNKKIRGVLDAAGSPG